MRDSSAASKESGSPFSVSRTQERMPTPACGEEGRPTEFQTAGPFFTPDSPERASFLESDLEGIRMVLTGRVLTVSCQPIANALIDFWHADNNGNYDNLGYKLRGHQYTDEQGQYQLETIVPGIYPGRTRHLHVKVQAANRRILTTQLYFPDEGLNKGDFLFSPQLLMAVQTVSQDKMAKFNFVLAD